MAEDTVNQTRESLVQLAPWAQPGHEPIPGERDPSTLTHREPGAVSGQFAGADIPPQRPDWLDRRTAFEHELEGGGDAVKRDAVKGALKKRSGALTGPPRAPTAFQERSP